MFFLSFVVCQRLDFRTKFKLRKKVRYLNTQITNDLILFVCFSCDSIFSGSLSFCVQHFCFCIKHRLFLCIRNNFHVFFYVSTRHCSFLLKSQIRLHRRKINRKQWNKIKWQALDFSLSISLSSFSNVSNFELSSFFTTSIKKLSNYDRPDAITVNSAPFCECPTL